MANLKAVVGDVLGSLFLDEPVVTRVTQVAPDFRRLDLQADAMRGGRARPGDKLQIFLPGVGPRTYSPFAFDGGKGTFSLLVYTHGDTPGAVWGQRVAVGERVRVFGPRGSLALDKMTGPVVIFGDETSLAVTRSLAEKRDQVRAVFETGNVEATKAACSALELPAAVVPRGEAETPLREALAGGNHVQLVLTGKAQSIQALRAAFKARPAPYAKQHVKAYWSVGKVGLD
jgi:NADPH-dependent ferric siderophore reductase